MTPPRNCIGTSRWQLLHRQSSFLRKMYKSSWLYVFIPPAFHPVSPFSRVSGWSDYSLFSVCACMVQQQLCVLTIQSILWNWPMSSVCSAAVCMLLLWAGWEDINAGWESNEPLQSCRQQGAFKTCITLLPTLGLFTVRSFQTKLLLSRWWLGINKSMQSHQLQCYFIWIKVLNRQAG